MSERPQPARQPTCDEIEAVVHTYRDRFNDNDADGLAEIYAVDISFINLGGLTFDGRSATREQQAKGFTGPLAGYTIELDIEHIRALGPDHVEARMRQTIRRDGSRDDETVSAARVTMILDRTWGSWLIRHLQSTPIVDRADSR